MRQAGRDIWLLLTIRWPELATRAHLDEKGAEKSKASVCPDKKRIREQEALGISTAHLFLIPNHINFLGLFSIPAYKKKSPLWLLTGCGLQLAPYHEIQGPSQFSSPSTF